MPNPKGKGRPKGMPAPSTAWKPGQSGNPAGGRRAEELHQWRAALRQVIPPESVAKMLGSLMESDDESIRIRAIDIYLDRMYGRPVQEISGESGGPIEVAVRTSAREYTDDELAAILAGAGRG